jgi:hypothetical protein
MYDVPWAGLAIGISLFFAIVVSVAGKRGSGRKWGQFRSLRLGPANWDFSSSWGSTFTAVGALLGTVLSATTLSNATLMSSKSYAGCNLFFGGLVVIAPFVFAATRKVDPTQPAPDGSGVAYDGSALSFLVSSAVTLWAVIGELWILMLLCWEFLRGPVAICCIIFLCAVELLVLRYGWSSVSAVLKVQAITQEDHQAKVNSIVRAQSADVKDAAIKSIAMQSTLIRAKHPWNVL